MKKLSTLLVVSAALAAGASAQTSTKIEKPFRAELGLYIPTFDGGDKDLGVNLGIGYSFYQYKGIDFAAVLRSNYFTASQSGIDGTFYLTNLGVDARYNLTDKFFVGLGLGAYRADVHVDGFGNDDTTKLGYSLEAGYNFDKKLYGLVRFASTTDDIDGFRGFTVGVGYRF